MRMIPLKKYDETTMQLAAPIYDAHRRVLLGKGQVIHPKYKERLLELGINMIIVEDEVSQGITLEDMLDMPAWMDAIAGVQAFYESVKKGKEIQLPLLKAQAKVLVSEMVKRKAIILTPSTVISSDIRLYAHAVNVTLLALQTAKKLSYNEFKLHELAVGCLLHDVGKVKSDDEREHPTIAFELLRKNRDISLLSTHIAFQHHEKWDGTGYPQGLSGKDVHEYAQICGVSNYYDNLISKEEVQPHIAMEMIMTLGGTVYTNEVVNAFVRSVPAYPPGTKVELHSGETGIVVKINSYLHRPVVRLFKDNREISLADHPTIMIQAAGE